MTPERLAAIRARLAAATPGPWRAGSRAGRTVYKGTGPDDLIGTMDSRADADFVAHAPGDLAELLGEVERLRGFFISIRNTVELASVSNQIPAERGWPIIVDGICRAALETEEPG